MPPKTSKWNCSWININLHKTILWMGVYLHKKVVMQRYYKEKHRLIGQIHRILTKWVKKATSYWPFTPLIYQCYSFLKQHLSQKCLCFLDELCNILLGLLEKTGNTVRKTVNPFWKYCYFSSDCLKLLARIFCFLSFGAYQIQSFIDKFW